MTQPANLPTDQQPTGRPAELRRVVRILRILRAIAEDPGRWQRAELAAQHQVSERMITKDLVVLRAIGLPVANAGGKTGGYYLVSEVDAHLLAAAGSAHMAEEIAE
jgi:DNA-binding IscR family transcriptional regulator